MTTSVRSWPRFAVGLIVGAAILTGCGGGGGGGGDTAPIAGPVPGPGPGAPGTNAPPVIKGAPGVAVEVGKQYLFQPTATDAENGSLTFAIASKPSWATFDAATGKLSGMPAAADVGVYEEIEISVSDGNSSAKLPKFALIVAAAGSPIYSVSLGWDIPLENDDGTPLTDLKAFRIHYGSASSDYAGTLEVASANATSHVVQQLPSGTYYFAITAVNADGVESAYSTEVNTTI
jgi:hypothetical protein